MATVLVSEFYTYDLDVRTRAGIVIEEKASPSPAARVNLIFVAHVDNFPVYHLDLQIIS